MVVHGKIKVGYTTTSEYRETKLTMYCLVALFCTNSVALFLISYKSSFQTAYFYYHLLLIQMDLFHIDHPRATDGLMDQALVIYETSVLMVGGWPMELNAVYYLADLVN